MDVNKKDPSMFDSKKFQPNLFKLIKVNQFNKEKGFKVVVEALVVENSMIHNHSWLGMIHLISVGLALLVFYFFNFVLIRQRTLLFLLCFIFFSQEEKQ